MGGLTLRESAQCPKEDETAFQDTSKYTYFNTNNLWVDLEKLKAAFDKHAGTLPLPVMLNDKTVDPRDKKCDDLVALRSDAYVLTEDFRIELAPERAGVPPTIKLDDLYKFVDAMDTLIPNGVPSLIGCSSMKVEGPIEFAAGVVVKGDVKFVNKGSDKKTVAAGTYENQTVEL